MAHRYRLQHRYQDSGWQDLPRMSYSFCGDAICKASELAEDAITYGMVRVVDPNGRVIVTFAAGGGYARNA